MRDWTSLTDLTNLLVEGFRTLDKEKVSTTAKNAFVDLYNETKVMTICGYVTL